MCFLINHAPIFRNQKDSKANIEIKDECIHKVVSKVLMTSLVSGVCITAVVKFGM